MLPAAARAISGSASRSKATFSSLSTLPRCAVIAARGICFRLNCRQRDSTVTGIFCGSVVARMNLMCAGGSSRVFSIELKAGLDSMCTSSITNTLKRPRTGT